MLVATWQPSERRSDTCEPPNAEIDGFLPKSLPSTGTGEVRLLADSVQGLKASVREMVKYNSQARTRQLGGVFVFEPRSVCVLSVVVRFPLSGCSEVNYSVSAAKSPYS